MVNWVVIGNQLEFGFFLFMDDKKINEEDKNELKLFWYKSVDNYTSLLYRFDMSFMSLKLFSHNHNSEGGVMTSLTAEKIAIIKKENFLRKIEKLKDSLEKNFADNKRIQLLFNEAVCSYFREEEDNQKIVDILQYLHKKLL